MSPTYAQLLDAGYAWHQVMSCPWNDQHERCPCQMGGPGKDCGMSADAILITARLPPLHVRTTTEPT